MAEADARKVDAAKASGAAGGGGAAAAAAATGALDPATLLCKDIIKLYFFISDYLTFLCFFCAFLS